MCAATVKSGSFQCVTDLSETTISGDEFAIQGQVAGAGAFKRAIRDRNILFFTVQVACGYDAFSLFDSPRSSAAL